MTIDKALTIGILCGSLFMCSMTAMVLQQVWNNEACIYIEDLENWYDR